MKLDFIPRVRIRRWRVQSGERRDLIYMLDDLECYVDNGENESKSGNEDQLNSG